MTSTANPLVHVALRAAKTATQTQIHDHNRHLNAPHSSEAAVGSASEQAAGERQGPSPEGPQAAERDQTT